MLSSLELDLRGGDDESDVVSPSVKTPKTMEFGGNSATVGGVGSVTETLTNMLSKTTSFLPEGLFASLGVTSGIDNDLRGVKMVSYVFVVPGNPSQLVFFFITRTLIKVWVRHVKM